MVLITLLIARSLGQPPALQLRDASGDLSEMIRTAYARGDRTVTLPDAPVLHSIYLRNIPGMTIRLGAVRGSVKLDVRPLKSSDPRYSEIPAGVRSKVWVGNLNSDSGSQGAFEEVGKWGPGTFGVVPDEVFLSGKAMRETVFPSAGPTSVNGYVAGLGGLPRGEFNVRSIPDWNPNNWSGRNRLIGRGYIYNRDFFYHEGSGRLQGTKFVWDSPGSEFEGNSPLAGSDNPVRVGFAWILETIAPGQYYIDRNTALVYVCSNTDPSGKLSVSVAREPTFVLQAGCDGVSFIGGSITETRWGGIENHNHTKNVTVKGVTFDVGGAGISFADDGWHISDCAFTCGGVGVKLYEAGDKETLRSSHATLDNCTFDGTRQRARSYAGGLVVLNTVGFSWRNCTFKNFGGHAVVINGSNDCLADGNSYQNCCLTAADAGVIYHGKHPSDFGNVFQNEKFTDCRRRATWGVFDGEVNCYYLDDMTSGITIKNASALRCSTVVRIGGGRSNRVFGVTSTDGEQPPIEMDDRAQSGHERWSRGSDVDLRQNMDHFLQRPAYAKYGPEFLRMLSDSPEAPKYNVLRGIRCLGSTPAQPNYSNKFRNAPVVTGP